MWTLILVTALIHSTSNGIRGVDVEVHQFNTKEHCERHVRRVDGLLKKAGVRHGVELTHECFERYRND